MESITQATQLYILADKLLGPKPRIVPPPVDAPAETYNQLAAELDAFGNALVELENILPDSSVLPEGGAELPPPPVDAVEPLLLHPAEREDARLLGHASPTGCSRSATARTSTASSAMLALFAPPIDPGHAGARGGGRARHLRRPRRARTRRCRTTASSVMARKATELAAEVRALGQALLSALEKQGRRGAGAACATTWR